MTRFGWLLPLALLFNTILAFASYPAFDPYQTKWETGQVLGISEMKADATTFTFEIGTGSRYGHVGVVSVEEKGVFVYEGNPPWAIRSTVYQFIKRAHNLAVTLVEPVVPLSTEEKKRLSDTMLAMVKSRIPYNYSMVMNEGSMNCAEFVRASFLRAGLRDLGTPEPFKQMNIGALGGAALKATSLYKTPMDAVVLSPVSIINDVDMKVVATNLPVERLMSEKEILEAWIEEDGITAFLLSRNKLPSTKVLNKIRQNANPEPYRAYPEGWRLPQE